MDEPFSVCVQIIVDIASFMGWTYEEANIYIFVIIQPALILLFFILMIWYRAKYKRTIAPVPIP